jgi:L-lactate utilization protein LutC
MSIFDKIFGSKKKPQEAFPLVDKQEDISADQMFVQKFTDKGGKFLYSDDESEILEFLKQIVQENAWESVHVWDKDLQDKLNVATIKTDENAKVFFTKCEHLIADEGSLLFSSKQLKEERLNQYPLDFIVYASTSQLTLNKDKALASIKFRHKNDIPTNISAIKDYQPEKSDPNFLNYGNNNSKRLYLLLFEDL